MNEQSIEQLKKDFDKTFPYLFSSCDGREGYDSEVTQDVWDFFLPHLISSDEIKREAIQYAIEQILTMSDIGCEVCFQGFENEKNRTIEKLKAYLTQSKEGGE